MRHGRTVVSTTVSAENLLERATNSDIRMLFQELNLPLEAVRVTQVITIHPGDERALACVETAIQ
jgi:hypothetical protein